MGGPPRRRRTARAPERERARGRDSRGCRLLRRLARRARSHGRGHRRGPRGAGHGVRRGRRAARALRRRGRGRGRRVDRGGRPLLRRTRRLLRRRGSRRRRGRRLRGHLRRRVRLIVLRVRRRRGRGRVRRVRRGRRDVRRRRGRRNVRGGTLDADGTPANVSRPEGARASRRRRRRGRDEQGADNPLDPPGARHLPAVEPRDEDAGGGPAVRSVGPRREAVQDSRVTAGPPAVLLAGGEGRAGHAEEDGAGARGTRGSHRTHRRARGMVRGCRAARPEVQPKAERLLGEPGLSPRRAPAAHIRVLVPGGGRGHRRAHVVQRHKRGADVRGTRRGVGRRAGRAGDAVHLGHTGGEEVRLAARDHLPRRFHRGCRAARVDAEAIRREPSPALVRAVRGGDARLHRGDGRGRDTAREVTHAAHDAGRGPRGSGQRREMARRDVGDRRAHANAAVRGIAPLDAPRRGARDPGVCARGAGVGGWGCRPLDALARVHRLPGSPRPR